MGFITKIAWTDRSWNPWIGCQKVSAGCAHCYMYRDQIWRGNDPVLVRRTKTKTFQAPLSKKWQPPALVFVCSYSDFFLVAADDWREDAYIVMRRAGHLIYQITTKRAENIMDRLPHDWGNGWPNVWLGVTVENKDYLDRARLVMDIPAAVRWISYEPTLGPVDFSPLLATGKIHWVVSGGESGQGYRAADPQWFRDVRDQCAQFGVAYFHKQNGGVRYEDDAAGGNKLDGQVYHAFPAGYVRAENAAVDEAGEG